jgi:hypothetical protein
MYDSYISCIKTITHSNFLNTNFKSNNTYNSILEHVSYNLGVDYLTNILQEFPDININHIIEFCKINDKYGSPNKYNYPSDLYCSPTSLRYIYHSLLILTHIKQTNNIKICEVGGGYGGLFLSINYFSNLLNINIEHYYIVDLPETCNLINIYLNYNKNNIYINFTTHNANNYGKDINDSELYFISNYCFTEIAEEHRNNYITNLLPKITAGFIIWQNCFNFNVNNSKILFKNKKLVIEDEKPQTSLNTEETKNFFVYIN